MNLHLILNNRNLSYRHRHLGGVVYETGNWSLHPCQVLRLEGGMLYLHRDKVHGSFTGGSILSIVPSDEAGRYVIHYSRDLSARWVFTDRWGREKSFD